MRLAVLLTMLTLAWAGCLGEAPHDNPLDPESDRFANEGGINGRVTDRNGQPLGDVEIHLLPVSAPEVPTFTTRTNSQGQFQLRAVPADASYQLRIEKPGFAAVRTEAVAVEAGASTSVPEMRLNALPVFEAIHLRSVHLSRWWPSDLYFLEILATAGDPDGLVDVEDVWMELPDFGFQAMLTPTSGGAFELRLDEESLPTPSLAALLGHSFSLYVTDQQGDTAAAAPRQLARVIDEIPVAASPSGDVLLETNQPTFVWDAIGLAFGFVYEVEVYRDEVNQNVLVQTLPGLPSTQTAVPLNGTLPTGQYFWTVTVIDDFGNRSRSKEAAFRIP